VTSARIIQSDVLDGLRQIEAGSVHTCVTSPPYWGLRDYGTAKWEGGDSECDHKEKSNRNDGGRVNTDGFHVSSANNSDKGNRNYTGTCPKCGATRIDDQIGLEKTPEEYVAKLVEVFREVRRVLRDDGTVWLNLGDSYASSTSNNGGYSDKSTLAGFSRPDTKGRLANDTGRVVSLDHGLKPKDLCGIPWRVAFALQADGWWLRSDIIWAKPNPMPQSVTDRPTSAHEYIFLLSKSARYFYDADAIAEKTTGGDAGNGFDRPHRLKHANGNPTPYVDLNTRNKRDVWTVATQPFPGAHFAVFPPKLIEPCILAGSPMGGTVLDPFSGSGTTGIVATKHGRSYVGVELNPEYAEMSRKRIGGTTRNLFAQTAQL